MIDETRDEAWTRRLQGRSLADAIEAWAAYPEGVPWLADALEERPELADHPLAVRRREALAGVEAAQEGVRRAIEVLEQASAAEVASRVLEVDAAEVVRWLREMVGVLGRDG